MNRVRDEAIPAEESVPGAEFLSPYAAMAALNLSEAQEARFLKAYDVAREVLRDLGIFPERTAAAVVPFLQRQVGRLRT